MKHLERHLAINVLIAAGVFLLSLKMHLGAFKEEILVFGVPGAVYYSVHFLLSLFRKKYNYGELRRFTGIFKKYFTTWLISSGLCLLILVLYGIDYLSREWILVNLFGLITGEAVMVTIVSLFRESARLREQREIIENGRLDVNLLYPPPPPGTITEDAKTDFLQQLLSNPELSAFASRHLDLHSDHCRVVNTSAVHEFLLLFPEKYKQIINLYRLDLTKDISQIMRAANSRLPKGGLLMVCSETMNLRKKRILHSYPRVLNRVIYFFDFLLMQVFPLLPGGRKLHEHVTNGKQRVLSRPEIMGRLSSCGFSILDEKKISGLLYVIVKKVDLPVSHVVSSYGIVIHLNRIGNNGNLFRFYKFRTMFPFSEYIQEYVYLHKQLDKSGKIKDDFRITPFGKFLRKYWIDELPGLWNWIRRDMKLVGVRPLSRHFYSLYTRELQLKRIQVKPGLIPPFYADLPKNLDEIMASELRYLKAYAQSPLLTDLRYFFKALYNIVIKGAKSG